MRVPRRVVTAVVVAMASTAAPAVGCSLEESGTSQPPLAGAALPNFDAAPSTNDASTVDASTDVTVGDAGSGGDSAIHDAIAEGAAIADVMVDAPADAAVPGAIASSVAPTQLDLVSKMDVGSGSDGEVDGTILATIVGPVDGLILVTTDATGTPASAQQWDTISGAEALPNIGSAFSVGSQTWMLGAHDGSGLINDDEGHIVLPTGTHSLTLAGSSSGFFVSGQHFRLYARALVPSDAGADADPDRVWIAGPVFVWP